MLFIILLQNNTHLKKTKNENVFNVFKLLVILQINTDSIVCPMNNLSYVYLILKIHNALSILNRFKIGNQSFERYENNLYHVIFTDATALSLITCNQFNELEEIFLEDEVFAYI